MWPSTIYQPGVLLHVWVELFGKFYVIWCPLYWTAQNLWNDITTQREHRQRPIRRLSNNSDWSRLTSSIFIIYKCDILSLRSGLWHFFFGKFHFSPLDRFCFYINMSYAEGAVWGARNDLRLILEIWMSCFWCRSAFLRGLLFWSQVYFFLFGKLAAACGYIFEGKFAICKSFCPRNSVFLFFSPAIRS